MVLPALTAHRLGKGRHQETGKVHSRVHQPDRLQISGNGEVDGGLRGRSPRVLRVHFEAYALNTEDSGFSPFRPCFREHPAVSLRRLDESSLSHLLGYAVAHARVASSKAFFDCIGGPLELRPSEFTLLMILLANSSVNQKELASALNLNAPNLTILVDRLVDRELVSRERSDEDRRAQFVRLTSAGKTLAERARTLSLDAEAPIRAKYSAAEWAILLELLRRIQSS